MKTNRTIASIPFAVSLLVAVVAAGQQPAAAARTRAGTVGMVNGRVVVISGKITFPAEPGSPIHEGDQIRSFNPGKAKIVFADDTVLNIGHDTELAVSVAKFSLDRRESFFDVLRGRFKVAVGKFLTGPTDFKLRTPTVVAGVRGTVFWGDTEIDALCALEGTVEITPTSNAAAARTLGAGDCAAKLKEGQASPITPSAEELKNYVAEVTPE